ncbi:hypothetical protein [Desulfonema magnum]|uniref:Uncharacterized protein n=1 Tax=Desulfonema magnum TaxID=45655 RepID=A0A975GPM3_9BACT|nr:hypothetical protein [Desulfonema magnum]QTA88950.1 Uncharacterized protein dnm_049970 [Desulfonema magnum]
MYFQCDKQKLKYPDTSFPKFAYIENSLCGIIAIVPLVPTQSVGTRKQEIRTRSVRSAFPRKAWERVERE